MPTYVQRTWGDLTPDEQLKFFFDWRHANECREGGETCLLGPDPNDEPAVEAFETVLADAAPDFVWKLEPAIHPTGGWPCFAIRLLPATAVGDDRLLPPETQVCRLAGERWEWREY